MWGWEVKSCNKKNKQLYPELVSSSCFRALARITRESIACDVSGSHSCSLFQKFRAYKAFTLAEVLITLVIIGVVAAITIPIIYTNYQKQVTVTSLQKAFNTLSNAYKMSVSQNGSSADWDLSAEWSAAPSKQFWQTYLVPYLSVAKSCTGANSSECWAANAVYLDNKPIPTVDILFLVLNDGTCIYLSYVGSGYGTIAVDINGLKKPNMMGKDIFLLDLYYINEYVCFNGINYLRTDMLGNYSGSCNVTPGTTKGNWCGALIQTDGWQIKSDYPW